MPQFKHLLLYTVSICGPISGCARLSDADETALRNEQFSPEAGRAAIVNLLRGDPETFGEKFSPREYAGQELVDEGRGMFRLGECTIDTVKHKYRVLHFTGRNTYYREYSGSFEFVDGRWVMQKPTTTRSGKGY